MAAQWTNWRNQRFFFPKTHRNDFPNPIATLSQLKVGVNQQFSLGFCSDNGEGRPCPLGGAPH
jgi:hypothetical protein